MKTWLIHFLGGYTGDDVFFEVSLALEQQELIEESVAEFARKADAMVESKNHIH